MEYALWWAIDDNDLYDVKKRLPKCSRLDLIYEKNSCFLRRVAEHNNVQMMEYMLIYFYDQFLRPFKIKSREYQINHSRISNVLNDIIDVSSPSMIQLIREFLEPEDEIFRDGDTDVNHIVNVSKSRKRKSVDDESELDLEDLHVLNDFDFDKLD